MIGKSGHSPKSLSKQKIAELRHNRVHCIWFDWYERLILFKDNFNRWPGYYDEYPKGCNVGLWAKSQWQIHKNGNMLAWRKRLLDKIGFFNDRNG